MGHDGPAIEGHAGLGVGSVVVCRGGRGFGRFSVSAEVDENGGIGGGELRGHEMPHVVGLWKAMEEH